MRRLAIAFFSHEDCPEKGLKNETLLSHTLSRGYVKRLWNATENVVLVVYSTVYSFVHNCMARMFLGKNVFTHLVVMKKFYLKK
jgi:hypothetical protein